MRRVLLAFYVVSLLAFISIPAYAQYENDYYGYVSKEKIKEVVEETLGKKPSAQCPLTQITDQNKCYDCHTKPNWRLIETPLHEVNIYPNPDTWISGDSGYFNVAGGIEKRTSYRFREAIDYFEKHEIKHITVLIDSPGGSLFDSWLIVGMIEQLKKRNITVETRTYSMAMSGAFMIFAAGTNGERRASPTAEFMWHELITFELFSISSPSDKEDAARVLRHLQNTINQWLSTRISKTKDEIDTLVKKKEWWLNGQEALDVELVDAFTNR